MTKAKYFPVQFDQTQSMSIYYMNTECLKCWQFCFNLNRMQKKGTWGTTTKEILPYKHFPFFHIKTRIKFIKKMSLFPSFLFALKFDQLKSINIWKSKLKNSGKIILYKPCYNCKICNSVNVYGLFFFIAVCYACTSCCIICIWHFDIFLLNTIPRWNWWVQTPIQGCESYRSHFHFLKWWDRQF